MFASKRAEYFFGGHVWREQKVPAGAPTPKTELSFRGRHLLGEKVPAGAPTRRHNTFKVENT